MGHPYIAESDSGSYVVRDIVRKDAEEIVSWSISDGRWACSCGDAARGPNRTRCEHIETVGRSLPLDIALRLASAVAAVSPARRGGK